MAYIAEFNLFQEESRKSTLVNAWIRQSAAASMPQLDQTRAFKGDSQSFSAITLQPLEAKAGVPMPYSWQLSQKDGSIILAYTEGVDTVWEIDSWRASDARFSYMTGKGEWVSSWPKDESQPLVNPIAIALISQKKGRPFSVYITLSNFPVAEIDFRDTIAEWEGS